MGFNFIDLFCGLGGFRLGLEKLGGKCVFSSDIDKNVQAIYQMNFHELPYGDITQIDATDIPEHDILCAGFPCQPFSIAGKRLGFDDIRGTLFFDIARIIKAKKPTAFILENVKGLVTHDNGKTLNIILSIIKELGYQYKYDVLNAKDYNIPQNRERWYCIGIRNNIGVNIENFIFPRKKILSYKLDDIIETCINNNRYCISSICENNINFFIDKKKINIDKTTLAYDIRPSRCNFSLNSVSNCLTAKMGTGGNNIPVLVKQKRKLTERECLRLMGFPDTYKIKEGYQAYKQIGNSVVVPIIYEIAKELVVLCDLN